MQPNRHTGTLVGFIVTLGLFGTVLWQRQAIADWLRLRGYTPSAEVARLANETTMSEEARRLFYINHPSIQNKADFNQSCPDKGGEQTIVLGCYRGNDNGIFLYKVTEPQLNGVMQVTAAHEMLHVVYSRLSGKERERIDKLLQDFYDNNLSDERIKGVFEAYKKTEPNDLINEMHSIFATELATLTPELEDYYGKYFVNREKVAELAAKYQQQFTNRKNQVAAYDAELTTLKAQIDANQKQLDDAEASIKSERARLDSFLASRQYEAYNASVPGFNQQVIAYNNLVRVSRSLIERYNNIVEQRNAISIEEQDLQKALDSNTAESPE